jgi:hypothetical protein
MLVIMQAVERDRFEVFDLFAHGGAEVHSSLVHVDHDGPLCQSSRQGLQDLETIVRVY